VTRHGFLWQALLSPGEQLAAQGENRAAKKTFIHSVEAVKISDEGVDGGEALDADGAPEHSTLRVRYPAAKSPGVAE